MCRCYAIPPHMLKAVALNAEKEERRLRAMHVLASSAHMAGRRGIRGVLAPMMAGFASSLAPISKTITIYDAGGFEQTPGRLIRNTTDAPSVTDKAANEAWTGADVTYDFYEKVFGRHSVDGRGLALVSTVHYGHGYDNAFWDGGQMVYGDGDGDLFATFTGAIDVIGHELTHGVTQFTAGLVYQGQSGALNESMSDCFGSMVKQFHNNQSTATADWLIGQGVFSSKVNGVALRSMKAPGSAYNDSVLGADPQPDHMSKYQDMPDDNGGVHINSGIPNKAFYLAATYLGGNSWDRAGPIWYKALTTILNSNATFIDAANATIQAAQELYGIGDVTKAIHQAWSDVGVIGRMAMLGGILTSHKSMKLEPPVNVATTAPPTEASAAEAPASEAPPAA